MARNFRRSGMVLLLSAGVVAAAASPALAGTRSTAHPVGQREIQQTVDVTGTGSSVKLSRSWVYAGSIRFVEHTTNPSTAQGGGSQIVLFQLKRGTLSQFFADVQKEFSQIPAVAAEGTRNLTRDATFLGLGDITTKTPETITENLTPGTYYLLDAANPPTGKPPALTTLTVRPGGRNIEQDSDLHSAVLVTTPDKRFRAPRVWPSSGTYTFRNVSDDVHIMEILPVKAHTTDAEVQAYFSGPQSGPPPFGLVGRPSAGNDAVSPGRSIQVTYHLPPGTYVLVCFVADDQTGMPHVAMGMHEVIVVR
jgi:plastocyanin